MGNGPSSRGNRRLLSASAVGLKIERLRLISDDYQFTKQFLSLGRKLVQIGQEGYRVANYKQVGNWTKSLGDAGMEKNIRQLFSAPRVSIRDLVLLLYLPDVEHQLHRICHAAIKEKIKSSHQNMEVLISYTNDYAELSHLAYRAIRGLLEEEIASEDTFTGIYSMRSLIEILLQLSQLGSEWEDIALIGLKKLLQGSNHAKVIEEANSIGFFSEVLNRAGIGMSKGDIDDNRDRFEGDDSLFSMLPPDGSLHHIIFSSLSFQDLVISSQVCKRWRYISRDVMVPHLFLRSGSMARIEVISLLCCSSAGSLAFLESVSMRHISILINHIPSLSRSELDADALSIILRLLSRITRHFPEMAHRLASSPLMMTMMDIAEGSWDDNVPSSIFGLRRDAFFLICQIISNLSDSADFIRLSNKHIFSRLVDFVIRDTSVICNLHSCLSKNLHFKKHILRVDAVRRLKTLVDGRDYDVSLHVLQMIRSLSIIDASVLLECRDIFPLDTPDENLKMEAMHFWQSIERVALST